VAGFTAWAVPALQEVWAHNCCVIKLAWVSPAGMLPSVRIRAVGPVVCMPLVVRLQMTMGVFKKMQRR
jgi:hypothetical protein